VRILQVARQFYPSIGGVENVVENLARQLIQRGLQCDVLTLNRFFGNMGQTLPPWDSVKGIDVIRIPFVGGSRFFLAPGVLRFVRDYDLVHIHNVDTFVDLLVATKPWHRRPLVLSTQGGYFHTRTALALKEIYFNTITRLTMRGLDAAIVVSEHDRSLFGKISSRLELISDGVDYATFGSIQKQVEPGLLVTVGRIASNKRVDRLLAAFARVVRERPTASLAIVGRPQDGHLSEVQALATRLGVDEKVVFAGEVDDAELRAWLGRANLFVSASEYESFGLSVLEAMSSGTVPVVNDIPAFRAAITPRENGFIADFGDVDQAADALLEALSLDPAQLRKMGKNAQKSVARYSWENVAVQLEQLYRRVLKERE